MSLKTIAVAATMGIAALALSGCVETSGSYSGGYYHHTSRPVVVDRSRHNTHSNNRNDWRRDRPNTSHHNRPNTRHDRDDRRAGAHHTPSRYDRAKFCRDNPRAPQCRSDRRH